MSYAFERKLTVVVLGFDGASENRTCMKNLATLTVRDLIEDGVYPREWLTDKDIPLDLKLAFEHPCSRIGCRILVFFHGDMPHAIKKFVNALERSGSSGSKTDLQFRSQHLSLEMCRECWEGSRVQSGLRQDKLTINHFNKTSASRMKVHLAVQITSKSMVRVIDNASLRASNSDTHREHHAPLRELLLLLDDVVDIMNGRNRYCKGVDSTESAGVAELIKMVRVFTEWKNEAINPCHTVPSSTWEDLCWLGLSVYGITSFYCRPVPEARLARAKKNPLVLLPLTISLSSFGTDNCEHQFASTKQKGAVNHQSAIFATNRADAMRFANNAFSLNSKTNSSGASVRPSDLFSKLPQSGPT